MANFPHLTYEDIEEKTTASRITAIEPHIQEGVLLLAKILNEGTHPWALMGSNAFLLHVDDSIQKSDDIDALCSLADLEHIFDRLGTMSSTGKCKELRQHKYPEGEVGVSGVLLIDNKEADFEIFAQNMDTKKSGNGLVRIAFGTYVLERHTFPQEPETPVYALNPEALIELYTKNFVKEFRNYEIADWEKGHSPKFKAARRMFNITRLGLDLTQFTEKIKQYEPKETELVQTIEQLCKEFYGITKDRTSCLSYYLKDKKHIEPDHIGERAMVWLNASVAADLDMLSKEYKSFEERFDTTDVTQHQKQLQTYDLQTLLTLLQKSHTLRKEAFEILGDIKKLEKKYWEFGEALGKGEFHLFIALPRVHNFFIMPIETILYARVINIDIFIELLGTYIRRAHLLYSKKRADETNLSEGLFRKDYEKYREFLKTHSAEIVRLKKEVENSLKD